MYRNTFRHRLTTGTWTLPIIAALAALTWLIIPLLPAGEGQACNRNWWLGLPLVAAITYGLVECNNRNALLRVRSRMMGGTYLLFVMACPALHSASWQCLPAAALLLAYFALFSTYGNPHAEGRVFHIFLPVGIASLLYAPLVLLVPVLLFSLAVHIRIMSHRTFGAALLGFLAPFWLVFGYTLWTGNTESFFLYIKGIWQWQPTGLGGVPAWAVGSCCIIGLLSFVSSLHYLRTAFNDKIRTRMFFYAILMVHAVLLLLLILRPADYTILLPMLAMNSAPLVGHHLTLARRRGSELWFYTCLLFLVVLLVANYFELWNSWLSFL